MKKRISFVLLASLVSLLFLSAPGYGQGILGAITGTIQDSTGAAVPDATITITNVDTGVKWNAKTSSAGYFRVAVPPANYQLQAEKQGFKKGIADKIIVPVEQVVTVDLTLQVGSLTEVVEVTSQTPLLTPSTAEVGTAMSPTEFQTLPIALDDGGRDLQTFIFSSLPGTIGSSWSGSINGGQFFSHEIMVDGVTIGRFDISGGSLTEFSPGTDAIGEFKVQNANFSAEYGETGSGVANFSYKSGTNEFHGTAFEYNQNPIFNANGAENNAFGVAKDNSKENDFGMTIGGPIRKEKTFFFFSYEGDRHTDFGVGGMYSLPTSNMKTGDFSALLGSQIGTDALGRPVYEGELYDPTTTRNVTAGEIDPTTGLTATSNGVIRDPFPGNKIPSAELSTASIALMGLFPNPKFAGTSQNTPFWVGHEPELQRDAYTGKVDHILTNKQKLSVSLNYNVRSRYNSTGPHPFAPFPGEPINPLKQQDVGGPMLRIAHTWTLTDTSLNQFTFGFNRFYTTNYITDNQKYTPSLGIPGISDDCFPTMKLSSHYIPYLPSSLGAGCETKDPNGSFVLQDTYSWLRGRHSVKVGTEIRRYQYSTYERPNISGTFTFNDAQTGLPGFTETGNPYASLLMGAAQTANRGYYGGVEPGYHSGIFAFFVQDDFKVTPKLTLNLGMRYEIPVPQAERFDRESGFNPNIPNPGADGALGALEFLGNCSVCDHRSSFEDWYFKEFGPRIGLAYQITPNFVFRGGYGISYSPPIEGGWGAIGYYGYTDSVNFIKGRSATGFPVDPVMYWSPLASASTGPVQVGFPAYTGTLPDLDPSLANGGGPDFLPRNADAQPYVQNWSVGLQYLLPHEILFQADYMGSKGTRLLNGYFGALWNEPQSKYLGLGDILGDDLATDLGNPVTAATLAQYGITKLPYASFSGPVSAAVAPFPQYSSITNDYPTDGNSTYNSLQVLGRKTTKHGLTFIAAYTFSKLLTDTDAALAGGNYSENVQDIWNPKSEKGLASFNHTQVIKLTWMYELPFGRGQRWFNSGGWTDRLVSGWQVTAIQNYQSGDPLSILSSLAYNSPFSDSGVIRADVVPGVAQTLPSQGLNIMNGTPYLNPAAFADPPSSPINAYPLRYGNSPPFLTKTFGPFQVIGENFGIIKDTRINERFNLQFRADMFNVFNRVGRGDPDTNLGDGLPSQGGTFGLINYPLNGPRVIQFALRLNY